MAGILGVYKADVNIKDKIDNLSHRGKGKSNFIKKGQFKISFIADSEDSYLNKNEIVVCDGEIYLEDGVSGAEEILKKAADKEFDKLNGMFALVVYDGENLLLARDHLGIKPLYYIKRKNGIIFASEAKALKEFKGKIKEFPPGHYFDSKKGFRKYFDISEDCQIDKNLTGKRLYEHLDSAVKKRMCADIGVWLSGGLDSSIIAAIASKYKKNIPSFFVGTKNSSDRPYAKKVSKHLGTRHYERILNENEIIKALPEVVYMLESSDPYLVRSSILNYFVAELTSEHVDLVLTGEGSDELFGGYNYLADIDNIGKELIKITNSLHNTAFQRVDRMSSAHGTNARIPFSDKNLVEYAFSLPVEVKVFTKDKQGKKILKKAAEKLLPNDVIYRKKIKFWQGSGGVSEVLSDYAERKISDYEFEKVKDNFESKEEYLYYKILENKFENTSFLLDAGKTENP